MKHKDEGEKKRSVEELMKIISDNSEEVLKIVDTYRYYLSKSKEELINLLVEDDTKRRIIV